MRYCEEKIKYSRRTITCLLLIFPLLAFSQGEKKFIRQGNREYEKNKYAESEISYRKAIDKNKEFPDAAFNAGDALYKQKKYENAGKQFAENHDMNDDNKKKSASLYNLGNSLLMSDNVKESINAYKGSLRLNPENMDAKYNLAYAQDLIREQEQKQQQQQEQQKQGISKEDAERVLNALANDEKNVQEKVKLAKALKAKTRTVKNW